MANISHFPSVHSNQKPLVIAATMLLFVFTPVVVFGAKAIEKNTASDTSRTAPTGQVATIDDNIVEIGNAVEINRDTASDVIAFGGNVTIRGSVGGDVIVAGGQVEILGPVSGSVRVAGGSVRIAATIGHNLMVAGGQVHIDESTVVGWNTTVIAGTMDLNGNLGARLYAVGADSKLNGRVAGDARFLLDRQARLALGPAADVGGDLVYTTGDEFVRDANARIVGLVKHEPQPISASGKVDIAGWFAGVLAALFGLFIVGFVALGLMSNERLLSVPAILMTRPWASIGWGLIVIVVMPLAILLIAITIIGIPLALISLALYLIALYIAKLVAAFTVGVMFLRFATPKAQPKGLLAALIVGVLLYTILTALPLIGFAMALVSVLWGFGGLVLLAYENYHKPKATQLEAL